MKRAATQRGESEPAKRTRSQSEPRDGASTEEGFVLLEVLIAFSILVLVILATSTEAIVSTVAASAAQQRSVAATLISADVASAEALPFSDLTAGLNPTADALAADPAIQTSGSNYVLKLTGATLATSNTNSSESPLVPHISTTKVGIPYRVATYPVASATGLVTLVVIVSWTSALGGTTQLVGETQIASP